MADSALFLEVYERLLEADLGRSAALVERAFFEVPARVPAARIRPPESPPGRGAARAHLTRISVTGFRGVGSATTLDLAPGPGLTVVVGRNGSGKSSFSEALEVALTGGCQRIADPANKALGRGWRNLHHPVPSIEVELAVAGTGRTRVRRSWAEGEELTEGSTSGLEALGWGDAMRTWRPFLGYDELGKLAAGPSKVFDAIWPLLGLSELSAAVERLATARRELTGRERVAKAAGEALREALDRSDDPRAADLVRRSKKRPPDLDHLEAEASRDAAGDRRAVAEIAVPTGYREAAAEIRAASAEVAARSRAVGARAELAFELLHRALAWQGHDAEAKCPVCGVGALDEVWRAETERAVAERQGAVAAAAAARAALVTAAQNGRAMCSPPPVGLGGEACEAWEHWADPPPDPAALAAHLERWGPKVEAAAAREKGAANAELAADDATWAPVRAALMAFVAARRAVDQEREFAEDLDRAREWLVDLGERLRAERFAPIRDRALECWHELRQGSSVSLDTLELAGTGTGRRLEISVALDGHPGTALAVMSQGELNALALSLFLPRVQLDETPFGFVVIDDPVQSLDPYKVDGLARLLARVARSRQVIVFTHDLRLTDSIRRLRVPARVVRVSRARGSSVRLREERAPFQAFLEDATAVALSREIGERLARRVVPGLCRSAIEAVLDDQIRSGLLTRGESSEDVEERIRAVTSLTTRFALAWFGDTAHGAKVLRAIDQRFGQAGVRLFRDVQAGAHGQFDGRPTALVDATRDLVGRLG